jgi:hypothetical protein
LYIRYFTTSDNPNIGFKASVKIGESSVCTMFPQMSVIDSTYIFLLEGHTLCYKPEYESDVDSTHPFSNCLTF